jgi:hypothetical protein
MDAQRIYGTHEVNLAVAPFGGKQELLCKVAETRKVPGEVAKRLVKLRKRPCPEFDAADGSSTGT